MKEFDIQLALAKDGDVKAMCYVADVYHTGIVDGSTSELHSIFKAKYWYVRLINKGGKRIAKYASQRLGELNAHISKMRNNKSIKQKEVSNALHK
jgi:hypothetical protein